MLGSSLCSASAISTRGRHIDRRLTARRVYAVDYGEPRRLRRARQRGQSPTSSTASASGSRCWLSTQADARSAQRLELARPSRRSGFGHVYIVRRPLAALVHGGLDRSAERARSSASSESVDVAGRNRCDDLRRMSYDDGATGVRFVDDVVDSSGWMRDGDRAARMKSRRGSRVTDLPVTRGYPPAVCNLALRIGALLTRAT